MDSLKKWPCHQNCCNFAVQWRIWKKEKFLLKLLIPTFYKKIQKYEPVLFDSPYMLSAQNIEDNLQITPEIQKVIINSLDIKSRSVANVINII